MLGILDSGLGGLTVLRRLRERLPTVDLVYLADQAHVPYGDRSDADVLGYLEETLSILRGRGVAAVVMGCNTTCAVAHRAGWPASPLRVLDIIDTAVQAVVKNTARRIGILATTATARSGAYGTAIRRLAPDREVREFAAPELVPLIEAGELTGTRVRDAVARACSPLGDIDLLVLACTHFPLLREHFTAVLGSGITLFDPADAQADAAASLAHRLGCADGHRCTRYITTGALAPFRASVEVIVGPLRDDVEQIEEEQDGNDAQRRTGKDLQERVGL
ncbi:MAG TPA: glutamate racemase [Candidatus Baltobacteraceae bacterium]|nr:glutamate racemase [Candidatus Baltobacteraceae bacterium]